MPPTPFGAARWPICFRMKFLADENVKRRLANFLLERGYEVKFIPKGSTDLEVAKIAKGEGRILLTHDSDFSNTLAFPPSEYSGIIIFKVHPPTFSKLREALESLLERLKPEDLSGRLIILEKERFWIVYEELNKK